MSTSGRFALVQGASRGIGLALTRSLLADPSFDRVFATCRRPEDDTGLARESNPGLEVLRLDAADEATISDAATAVRGSSGRLDLLINVAGILHDGEDLGPEKKLESITPEGLRRTFDVNAAGPLLVLKHFHRLLAHDSRSVIANVSARVGSIADNRLGGWYGYRGSKAALNMFTRTAAIELGRRARNAIVVAVHPGTVDTDLSRPFQKSVPSSKLFAPARAAEQSLAVLDGLRPEQSGTFVAWDGTTIPW